MLWRIDLNKCFILKSKVKLCKKYKIEYWKEKIISEIVSMGATKLLELDCLILVVVIKHVKCGLMKKNGDVLVLVWIINAWVESQNKISTLILSSSSANADTSIVYVKHASTFIMMVKVNIALKIWARRFRVPIYRTNHLSSRSMMTNLMKINTDISTQLLHYRCFWNFKITMSSSHIIQQLYL